jgi:hypothetical protein
VHGGLPQASCPDGVSFNVAESETASATAYGSIDDLVLTGLTVAGGEGGFIGSDPPRRPRQSRLASWHSWVWVSPD